MQHDVGFEAGDAGELFVADGASEVRGGVYGLVEREVELNVKCLWALVTSVRLIVDLVLTEMFLQLAFRGKDLRAHCALLVLEFIIAETVHLIFTEISICFVEGFNSQFARPAPRHSSRLSLIHI